jgi:hypothetical protein
MAEIRTTVVELSEDDIELIEEFVTLLSDLLDDWYSRIDKVGVMVND